MPFPSSSGAHSPGNPPADIGDPLPLWVHPVRYIDRPSWVANETARRPPPASGRQVGAFAAGAAAPEAGLDGEQLGRTRCKLAWPAAGLLDLARRMHLRGSYKMPT